jgi:membrane-anchored protein YejM (alkaline phosphatase superfamily)
MSSLVSNSYSKKLLRLISWSHWFTFFNIGLAILLSSIYLFADPAPSTIFGKIYLVSTWISHIAFLTFLSFVLIVFPITLLFPYTRFIRTFSSIVFTILLSIMVLDAFCYNALGYHLSASSSEQVIALLKSQIDRDSRSFWAAIIVITSLILTFELMVSNYAWRHIQSLQKMVFARYSVMTLVGAFIFSHISHIWADANLNYDILKQDNLLPISQPSTAKALLAKYGLFDQNTYLENKTAPLSFNDPIPDYPVLGNSCPLATANSQSVYMVLTKKQLTEQQVSLFSQRVDKGHIRLAHHIDNSSTDDAWFNLFYSLPNIYQKNILSQNKDPIIFQLLQRIDIKSTLTVISENSPIKQRTTNDENHGESITLNNNSLGKLYQDKVDAELPSIIPLWVAQLFDQQNYYQNVSPLIFGENILLKNDGLHVVYFDTEDDYQIELFIEALLLNQQKQKTKNIVWISSLGNHKVTSQLSKKANLLILPDHNNEKIRILTSQMDIQPTLIHQWLNCYLPTSNYGVGEDVLSLNDDRVIANTLDNGLMIFDKDKSVFVDQQGNFESYSIQLKAPIETRADYPLMIDGVHYIKKFTKSNNGSSPSKE